MRERNPAHRSAPGAWVDHHAYSFTASLGRVLGKPWGTALTVGVMAIALVLPLGLWLVLGNVARFSGQVQESPLLSKGKAPDVGLAQLRAAGLGEAIDALDAGANPLPSLLVVTPAGDEALLAQSLQSLPEADLVQHDALWRQRLDGWLRFGNRVAAVLAILLGLGALLVVGNTVRLDIQSRRDEIGVLQYLGASDGFIRRPFLYLGAWYGLAAGALAIALLTAAALALRTPLAALAASYGSHFTLSGFEPPAALAVIAGAVLLGWSGAGIVTGHYLRQTRPTET